MCIRDSAECVLFVDAEALALKPEIIARAFARAEAGGIFAVAYAAGHSPVFAGSAYLCFQKSTWRALGSPLFRNDAPQTIGLGLSQAADADGRGTERVYPNYVLSPNQGLGGDGCIGVGTFYEEGALFCLYQPRGVRYAVRLNLLQQVADAALCGRTVDYLDLYRQIHHPHAQPDDGTAYPL